MSPFPHLRDRDVKSIYLRVSEGSNELKVKMTHSHYSVIASHENGVHSAGEPSNANTWTLLLRQAWDLSSCAFCLMYDLLFNHYIYTYKFANCDHSVTLLHIFF